MTCKRRLWLLDKIAEIKAIQQVRLRRNARCCAILRRNKPAAVVDEMVEERCSLSK